jgi:subtilisin family serine protease
MMRLSGTSMATPVVAGAAALMLQANPRLTPNLVKAILMYSAQPLAGCEH